MTLRTRLNFRYLPDLQLRANPQRCARTRRCCGKQSHRHRAPSQSGIALVDFCRDAATVVLSEYLMAQSHRRSRGLGHGRAEHRRVRSHQFTVGDGTVMLRVLFVCSQNKLRSPTAEQVFAGHPGVECTSAGTNNDAENPLNAELVEWAEVIVVMERQHRTKVAKRFRKELGGKCVVCLDIPDRASGLRCISTGMRSARIAINASLSPMERDDLIWLHMLGEICSVAAKACSSPLG